MLCQGQTSQNCSMIVVRRWHCEVGRSCLDVAWVSLVDIVFRIMKPVCEELVMSCGRCGRIALSPGVAMEQDVRALDQTDSVRHVHPHYAVSAHSCPRSDRERDDCMG